MNKFLVRGGLVLVILLSLLVLVLQQVKAQEDIAAELAARLVSQGVPLKSFAVTSRIPLKVEFVIQSTGTEKVTPDDPIFMHLIMREAMFAQRRGHRIEWVKITVLDRQGKVIVTGEQIVKQLEAMGTAVPGAQDPRALELLIRQEFATYGMAFDKVEVSTDAFGKQQAAIHLRAQTIQQANEALPKFMLQIRGIIFDQFNTRNKANIRVIRISLLDAKGESLLSYVRDLDLDQENWTQADGLTEDWYPHPRPIRPGATNTPPSLPADIKIPPPPTSRRYP